MSEARQTSALPGDTPEPKHGPAARLTLPSANEPDFVQPVLSTQVERFLQVSLHRVVAELLMSKGCSFMESRFGELSSLCAMGD